MKKSIISLFIVSLPLLGGCGWHYTKNKIESGVVIEKQYKAPMDASGYSYNGNDGIGYHTLSDEEKYIVVFKCDHGVVFSINKSELYGKLEKGDTVRISYRELLNGDNEVKSIDFINASKKK